MMAAVETLVWPYPADEVARHIDWVGKVRAATDRPGTWLRETHAGIRPDTVLFSVPIQGIPAGLFSVTCCLSLSSLEFLVFVVCVFFFRKDDDAEKMTCFDETTLINVKCVIPICSLHTTSAKPVSPRARVLYINQINQSIDRSNRRPQVIQSINQSTYQSCDILSIPNQSINQLTTIAKSVYYSIIIIHYHQ